MNRLFRRIFLVKEIKSKEGVLHFQRWRILNLGIFAIYIHKIYEQDHDKHLHNHPWNYINIILKGGYMEATEKKGETILNKMIPLKYSMRNANKYHKIHSMLYPTTTLFLTGKRRDSWGYNVNGIHIDHVTYRNNKRTGLYD